ncbi:helix-turn-helix domain-containing protein [Arthrobacter sp. UM1]|uniref:helix-turn-helix domain-containing protein n=1 Tax=Arthrobacter sp. UM1 TaxID=2766776 RepID=UPI001CF6F990|nr:helix-turn-helix domain-containing protein [Arthrobacter sp. UM1]MCB4208402.1 helix-turn-helix domain-containing protein [Arthrobacter sp. UM1]
MSPNAPTGHTVLPPADLEKMFDLGRFLDGLEEPAALVGPDGETVPLPLEVFHVLRDAAEALKAGKAITVAPVNQTLTAQEAADFLGMSRPAFVRLLEDGRLPSDLALGETHRRVRLEDVLEYQQRSAAAQQSALAELTVDAQKSGLYEMDAESYREALAAARRELHKRGR